MKSENNKKVAVLLSGGVDSAVAAARLKRRGFDVRGYFLALSQHLDQEREGACCSPEDAADARRVAAALEIPFKIVNLEREFKRLVFEPYLASYMSGETPNPCCLCNPRIKFGVLMKLVTLVSNDFMVATGHHARKKRFGGRWALLKGADPEKDQSYFLFGLTQSQLEQALFPVGTSRKEEVRDEAAGLGLAVAGKKESQDVCFVHPKRRAETLAALAGEYGKGRGEIVDADGTVIGRHDGIWNFTVGQRKGLSLRCGRRLYVLALVPEENKVVVGPKEDLLEERFLVRDYNNVALLLKPGNSVECYVKVRYKSKLVKCRLEARDGGRAEVFLEEPHGPIAPGQAAVFYIDDMVVGGGWIEQPSSTAGKERGSHDA